MPPKPSRMVAVVASMALAACSSIGTINGQRLDVGATPNDAGPAPHYWHPCEDFEWLCIVAVAAVAGGIVLALQKEKPLPPGVTAQQTTPTTPTPTPPPGP
jgi:hypothetical protein